MESARPFKLDELRAVLGQVIRGKADTIDLLLTGVLAGGHVLLEDVPGVGKTTLAKALARACRLDFARIQFTPDLLPADVLGSQILHPQQGRFEFRRGPVFTHVLLADEINRASPRTQSALLEAMNEAQVTVDGTTYPLARPFFVLATQNPVDFHGTYPLPEAQLDRFLLCLRMGYPEAAEELEMLLAGGEADPLASLEPVLEREEILTCQRRVRAVLVKPEVAQYSLEIVRATRAHRSIELGVSPRGSLAFLRAAQARAFLQGRDYAVPQDFQHVALAVLAHRVVLTAEARYGGKTASAIVSELVDDVAVPI